MDYCLVCLLQSHEIPLSRIAFQNEVEFTTNSPKKDGEKFKKIRWKKLL